MLQFYYDCLRKYLNPNSFELIETDTDSLYMGLNQPTLEQCVKKELLSDYRSYIYQRCGDNLTAEWFPRLCCDKHKAIDRRYCGIFSLEFKGCKMVALCSKSYIIENQDGKQKVSCKGISKKGIDQPMDKFLNTLISTKTNTSHNMGFRLNNGEMFTYDQTKIGFNYFYCKREVLNDGINTKPLNFVLCPWEHQMYIINKIHNPMSNLYECNIILENGKTLKSLEQAYYYLFAKICGDNILMERILQCTDPLLIYPMISRIVTPKKWLSNRIEYMTYLLNLKFNQCVNFRKILLSTNGMQLIYKQQNYCKKEVYFWSVVQPDNLVRVLPMDSLVGNNNMGVLLMSLRNKNILGYYKFISKIYC